MRLALKLFQHWETTYDLHVDLPSSDLYLQFGTELHIELPVSAVTSGLF